MFIKQVVFVKKNQLACCKCIGAKSTRKMSMYCEKNVNGNIDDDGFSKKNCQNMLNSCLHSIRMELRFLPKINRFKFKLKSNKVNSLPIFGQLVFKRKHNLAYDVCQKRRFRCRNALKQQNKAKQYSHFLI